MRNNITGNELRISKLYWSQIIVIKKAGQGLTCTGFFLVFLQLSLPRLKIITLKQSFNCGCPLESGTLSKAPLIKLINPASRG